MAMIGIVDLADAPRVAVGFSDKHPQKIVDKSIQQGLDIAELRIDLFSMFDSSYVKKKLADFSELGTIGTIRSKAEGGQWTDSEKQRFKLFCEIVNEVDSIDIELNSTEILRDVAGVSIDAEKTLIISHHDYEKTPSGSELDDIVDRSKEAGADVVKIATMVKSDRDIQILAELTISRKSENLVVIGMGSIGLLSRLLFPKLGSLMTYAYIGKPTAPGQLHFEEFVADLRRYYPAYNQRLIDTLELIECC